MDVQESGNAAAEHQDAGAGRKTSGALAAQNAGQRLNECSLLKADFFRQFPGAVPDIDCRETDEFAKAARIKMGSGEQGVANGLVAVVAVMAGETGDVVSGADPVADRKAGNALADGRYLAGNLVAEDKRGFMDAIPLHDIAAADPAGLDPDQQFTGSDRRRWVFLQPDIPVVVIHGNAH